MIRYTKACEHVVYTQYVLHPAVPTVPSEWHEIKRPLEYVKSYFEDLENMPEGSSEILSNASTPDVKEAIRRLLVEFAPVFPETLPAVLPPDR